MTMAVSKKDSFYCVVCELSLEEKGGETIRCSGICHSVFHIACLKITDEGEEIGIGSWKCQDCLSGQQPCMICKSCEGDLIRCCHSACTKFYHLACLNSGLWPQTKFSGSKMTCPAHVCHTCAADSPIVRSTSHLIKCIRCPTTFHFDELCIAAGSESVTTRLMVCPKHYQPQKSKKGSHHINTGWCFICSQGGNLICCEICPASFHAECLKIEPPEGVFYCTSCEEGKLPLFGEVLWVKLGTFRWWPARVMHPNQVPDNIERLQHAVGEFTVQFCGTKEYSWMNRGRSYPYQEGDSERSHAHMRGSSSAALDSSFLRGLSEAADLHRAFEDAKNAKEAGLVDKFRTQTTMKPDQYVKLKSNKPFGDCPISLVNPADLQACNCDPNSNDPCGPDSECLNRYLLYECCPTTCPAKEKCKNNRFQRQLYPEMAVRHTAKRGWGLYLEQDVKKGDFVVEYVGELITTQEYRNRLKQKSSEQNYYYMVMDPGRVIDAGPKGNNARFMNHSCEPNCETQKWMVNGDTRIGLFAKEDIPKGAELTFNYQFESVGDSKTACLCGAKSCSGFIGEKKTKEKLDKSLNSKSAVVKVLNNVAKKKAKSGKKAKRGQVAKKIWENLCFRCYDGGVVLMCDYKNCPKVYHLVCVNQTKMPRERWFCPWHSCVVCGKSANRQCFHCPNSYCGKHDSALHKYDDGKIGNVCNEHLDDFHDVVKFYSKIEASRSVWRRSESPTLPSPLVPGESRTAKDTAAKKSSPMDYLSIPATNPDFKPENKLNLTCDGSQVSTIRRRKDCKRRLSLPSFKEPFPNTNVKTADSSMAQGGGIQGELVTSIPSPASSACIPCTAPECKSFVHRSNMSRHWRRRHSDLNQADFSQHGNSRKTSFVSPESEPSINKDLATNNVLSQDNNCPKVVVTPVRAMIVSPKGNVTAIGLKRCRSITYGNAENSSIENFVRETDLQNCAKKLRSQKVEHSTPNLLQKNKKDRQTANSDSPGNPGIFSAKSPTQNVSLDENAQENRVAKRPQQFTPLNSNSCVQCQVPKCKMFIHKSDMDRHLTSWHQGKYIHIQQEVSSSKLLAISSSSPKPSLGTPTTSKLSTRTPSTPTSLENSLSIDAIAIPSKSPVTLRGNSISPIPAAPTTSSSSSLNVIPSKSLISNSKSLNLGVPTQSSRPESVITSESPVALKSSTPIFPTTTSSMSESVIPSKSPAALISNSKSPIPVVTTTDSSEQKISTWKLPNSMFPLMRKLPPRPDVLTSTSLSTCNSKSPVPLISSAKSLSPLIRSSVKPGPSHPSSFNSNKRLAIKFSGGCKFRCNFTACLFSTKSRAILYQHRKQWGHMINIRFARKEYVKSNHFKAKPDMVSHIVKTKSDVTSQAVQKVVPVNGTSHPAIHNGEATSKPVEKGYKGISDRGYVDFSEKTFAESIVSNDDNPKEIVSAILTATIPYADKSPSKMPQNAKMMSLNLEIDSPLTEKNTSNLLNNSDSHADLKRTTSSPMKSSMPSLVESTALPVATKVSLSNDPVASPSTCTGNKAKVNINTELSKTDIAKCSDEDNTLLLLEDAHVEGSKLLLFKDETSILGQPVSNPKKSEFASEYQALLSDKTRSPEGNAPGPAKSFAVLPLVRSRRFSLAASQFPTPKNTLTLGSTRSPEVIKLEPAKSEVVHQSVRSRRSCSATPPLQTPKSNLTLNSTISPQVISPEPAKSEVVPQSVRSRSRQKSLAIPQSQIIKINPTLDNERSPEVISAEPVTVKSRLRQNSLASSQLQTLKNNPTLDNTASPPVDNAAKFKPRQCSTYRTLSPIKATPTASAGLGSTGSVLLDTSGNTLPLAVNAIKSRPTRPSTLKTPPPLKNNTTASACSKNTELLSPVYTSSPQVDTSKPVLPDVAQSSPLISSVMSRHRRSKLASPHFKPVLDADSTGSPLECNASPLTDKTSSTLNTKPRRKPPSVFWKCEKEDCTYTTFVFPNLRHHHLKQNHFSDQNKSVEKVNLDSSQELHDSQNCKAVDVDQNDDGNFKSIQNCQVNDSSDDKSDDVFCLSPSAKIVSSPPQSISPPPQSISPPPQSISPPPPCTWSCLYEGCEFVAVSRPKLVHHKHMFDHFVRYKKKQTVVTPTKDTATPTKDTATQTEGFEATEENQPLLHPTWTVAQFLNSETPTTQTITTNRANETTGSVEKKFPNDQFTIQSSRSASHLENQNDKVIKNQIDPVFPAQNDTCDDFEICSNSIDSKDQTGSSLIDETRISISDKALLDCQTSANQLVKKETATVRNLKKRSKTGSNKIAKESKAKVEA